MIIQSSRISEVESDIIDWLQKVTLMMNDGSVASLKPAPFYDRRDVLTPEVVTNVIGQIEAYLDSEIKRYPQYHNTHQHIAGNDKLVTPGFDKLTPIQQRAIVERLDEMLQKIRDTGEAVDHTPTPAPPYAPPAAGAYYWDD